MNITDILIHVDQDLSSEERDRFEAAIHGHDGVISAHFSPKHTHLITVTYDPMVISSDQLLALVDNRGIHAEKIGL